MESIEQTRNENQLLKTKVAELELSLAKATVELEDMKKKYSDVCRKFNKRVLKNIERKFPSTNGIYDNYEDAFGSSFVSELRGLDQSSRFDSTFILKCMKQLFGNTSQLDLMTACGTDGKFTVPVEKREIIHDLFLQRLSSQGMSDIQISERYRRVNILINSAINNIRRANSPKKKNNDSDSQNEVNYFEE